MRASSSTRSTRASRLCGSRTASRSPSGRRRAVISNHRIPLQWPDPDMKKKGLRQEDFARVRKHKRLRGKLHCMLEKLDHGHHVLRVYCKSLVARLYEKFSTFRRLEICVNRLTHKPSPAVVSIAAPAPTLRADGNPCIFPVDILQVQRDDFTSTQA